MDGNSSINKSGEGWGGEGVEFGDGGGLELSSKPNGDTAAYAGHIAKLKEEVVQEAISWFQIRAEHATDCIQDEYGYCVDAVVIDENEAYRDFAKATEKLIAAMEGE